MVCLCTSCIDRDALTWCDEMQQYMIYWYMKKKKTYTNNDPHEMSCLISVWHVEASQLRVYGSLHRSHGKGKKKNNWQQGSIMWLRRCLLHRTVRVIPYWKIYILCWILYYKVQIAHIYFQANSGTEWTANEGRVRQKEFLLEYDLPTELMMLEANARVWELRLDICISQRKKKRL